VFTISLTARAAGCLHGGMTVEDTVVGLWKALSARDWEGIKSFIADDCIYLDVPVGPAAAARGPDDIVKRLKLGIAPLASYENHEGLLVSDGANVMYEHSETWVWVTGETVTLPFVTVHRVENGKVTLWKDYADMGTLYGAAPASWMDELMAGDMSWTFDATGMI
jgi:limonene-1,2-epoxide hydrolase